MTSAGRSLSLSPQEEFGASLEAFKGILRDLRPGNKPGEPHPSSSTPITTWRWGPVLPRLSFASSMSILTASGHVHNDERNVPSGLRVPLCNA